MKTSFFVLTALMFLAACGGKEPSPREATQQAAPATPTDAGFVTEARAATNKMQIELKQALTAAMAEGGAVHALSVCQLQAPALATQVSTEAGLNVWRVSERNRNPQNVPTEPQRAVLRRFESHPALEDTVIVEGEKSTYLRAIRVGVDLCLQCHGDAAALGEDVTAKLVELYPQDQATGFKMGDLRGAFVVQRAAASGD